jgi:hypothetical protein
MITSRYPTTQAAQIGAALDRLAPLHDHLCPRQVLGVRIGLHAAARGGRADRAGATGAGAEGGARPRAGGGNQPPPSAGQADGTVRQRTNAWRVATRQPSAECPDDPEPVVLADWLREPPHWSVFLKVRAGAGFETPYR